MALTYFEISYPNFVLGAIIDPEEANQNNYEIVTKVNDIISAINKNENDITNLSTIKANVTYVDEKILNLAGEGRTTETIKQNATNLINHKTSSDHDSRYYTEIEIDNKINTLATKTELNLKANKSDVYTKTELTPWLRGGDTTIREDVFVIVNSNNGDGTFTYSIDGDVVIGQLGENGEQLFDLVSGYYEPGTNRIEATINDTLRRSAKSGGLIEIDNTIIGLTQPEGDGAEITFKYYERIGMTAEYNIKLSVEKPPKNDGKNMWFKVIG